jgi:hypothetical protein
MDMQPVDIGQTVRVELSDEILCGLLTYQDDDWVEISHVDLDRPGKRQRSLLPKNEVISMKRDGA